MVPSARAPVAAEAAAADAAASRKKDLEGSGGVQGSLPWLVSEPSPDRLPDGFFERPVLDVARDLLGKRLVSTVGGKRAVGVIVETEAYQGPDDPASHAATRSGRTHRNRAMFGPGGCAYVYRSYGVHWCMNVVTGVEGRAEAVLIRGIEPVEGIDIVVARRGGREPLAAGPGRLCEALAITGDLYGHRLNQEPLELVAGWQVPDSLVGVSGRIGVSAAAERPFRFYVLGSPGVSPHRLTAP